MPSFEGNINENNKDHPSKMPGNSSKAEDKTKTGEISETACVANEMKIESPPTFTASNTMDNEPSKATESDDSSNTNEVESGVIAQELNLLSGISSFARYGG